MDVVRRICDRKVLVSDIGEVPVYEYEHDVNGVGQVRIVSVVRDRVC